MEFVFTTEQTLSRTDEIVDYLLGPRLWIPKVDYPDYEDWIQKVHAQLKQEDKRAIVALSCRSIVGAIIYQRHQTESEALEIKNITVRPDVQGRFIASFLLRNAEVEGARDFGIQRVLVDSKARNLEIRSFLFRNGYTNLGTHDLYGLGSGEDIVYSKRLYQGVAQPG